MTTLSIGDQAPWFSAPALDGNPDYAFDAVGGHVVLMLFGGSMGQPQCARVLETLLGARALFDDRHAVFFGVSIDPADVAERRIAQQLPGIRWFLDHDRAISTLYGAGVAQADGGYRYQPHFLLLDQRLRVVSRFPIEQVDAALAATTALIAGGCEVRHAPVLTVPRVFEPDVCRYLIDLYDRHGGSDSGFMRERNGFTVPVIDHGFKRRSDHVIEDPKLQRALMARIVSRLLPEIRRAFQFEATRMERWLIACYDAEAGGGFFSRHRDDTTRGTAHRRFACTINLDAERYEGGDLCFPEYGTTRYRAPSGGAVIFSCSLLHEVMPVTAGRRYAFLPFFYDEASASLREQNQRFVANAHATGLSPTFRHRTAAAPTSFVAAWETGRRAPECLLPSLPASTSPPLAARSRWPMLRLGGPAACS